MIDGVDGAVHGVVHGDIHGLVAASTFCACIACSAYWARVTVSV
jgi:hypothetical protein